MSIDRPVTDVLILGVPKALNPFDPRVYAKVYATVVAKVHEQYEPGENRPTISIQKIETLITNQVEDIDAFQPAHDCPGCIEGNRKAREAIADGDGKTYLALANIWYTEHHPDTTERASKFFDNHPNLKN